MTRPPPYLTLPATPFPYTPLFRPALPLPPPHCCAAGRNFMTRLKSRFLVDLLLRRTEAAGGFATIVAKGDETSGIILVQCSDRGKPGPLDRKSTRLNSSH